jgi:dUTP pyrophosphatase
MKDKLTWDKELEIYAIKEKNNLIKIKLDEGAKLPLRKHKNDAGADLFSNQDVIIYPGETKVVGTGNYFSIPEGFEIQIRSRSGLALKNSVFVLNSPGTIDSGYIGEVGVILHNAGKEPFVVSKGDRIAQAVIAPVCLLGFEVVDTLEETDRGDGGFGSTGVK